MELVFVEVFAGEYWVFEGVLAARIEALAAVDQIEAPAAIAHVSRAEGRCGRRCFHEFVGFAQGIFGALVSVRNGAAWGSAQRPSL